METQTDKATVRKLSVQSFCLALARIDSIFVNSKGHVANARFVSETVGLDSAFSRCFEPFLFYHSRAALAAMEGKDRK